MDLHERIFDPLKGASLLQSERFWRLCREGLWVTLGQVAAIAGGLVGVRLLTGLMEPAAYGELALGMTVATLVNQVVLGPLGNGATRFYAPAHEAGDLRGYLAAVRRMVSTATAWVILVGLLLIVCLVIARHTEWLGLAASALVFALLSGHNSVLNGIQNAARQRSVVALHQGMESWARVLAAAGLMVLLGASSTVAMFGYCMGVILVLGSQYLFFRKIVPGPITGVGKEKSWQEQMWNYSWPMAVTGVMSWGFFASQRWALELFVSTEDVGYFSAIFQIGFTPFTLAGGTLMTLIMPIIFGRVGDGADKQRVNMVAKSIYRFCLVASFIVLLSTAIGAVFHEMIFRLMVAEEYRVVSHYLPFSILAGGMFQLSLFLSTIILASTETRMLLPINTIGNSLFVGINLLFTYRYGMGGLFFAMVIGSAVHFLWNIYNVWKVSRNV